MAHSLVRLPNDEFRARGYQAVSTPFFLLKTKRNGSKRTRLGIVISKGVDKSAVKRNFWKRQAKEGILKEATEGSDILIIFSPAVSALAKGNFRVELSKALRKIKK
jgi:ribonuclease P protein component